MSDDHAKQPASGAMPPQDRPGDETSPVAPQAAENICRACNGTGRLEGKPCPECVGTGKVVETVGDA